MIMVFFVFLAVIRGMPKGFHFKLLKKEMNIDRKGVPLLFINFNQDYRYDFLLPG
jgi:hypothetical protein